MNAAPAAPAALPPAFSPISLPLRAPVSTPVEIEVPAEILTGRYTSSVGLRMVGWVAPELAARAMTSVESFIERVAGPLGGQHRVVSR